MPRSPSTTARRFNEAGSERTGASIRLSRGSADGSVPTVGRGEFPHFCVACNVACGRFRRMPPESARRGAMALRVTDHAEAMLAGAPRARSRAFLVALALITLVPLVGVPLVMAVAMARGSGLI